MIGGLIFFTGMLVMAYNVWMTTRRDVAVSITQPETVVATV
jgi:cbb3-type cytochrome oxidase subunit 1